MKEEELKIVKTESVAFSSQVGLKSHQSIKLSENTLQMAVW